MFEGLASEISGELRKKFASRAIVVQESFDLPAKFRIARSSPIEKRRPFLWRGRLGVGEETLDLLPPRLRRRVAHWLLPGSSRLLRR